MTTRKCWQKSRIQNLTCRLQAQGKLSKALAKELQVALHIKQCQFAKKEMSSGRKTKQQANN